VTPRRATEDDREVLRELWEEFQHEVPEPPSFEETWDEAWVDVARHIREGAVFVAEDEDGPVGFSIATKPEKGRSHLTDVYVRPRARREGVTKELLRDVLGAVRELGAERLSLDVLTSNVQARTVWERLGFVEVSRFLAADLSSLEARLDQSGAGPSFGSVHVQTDDLTAVERAVRQFVPRLPGGSRGTVVSPPRNGWIAVYDELCDREPEMLRRLAREISDRMGAVVVAIGVEHGTVVRYVLLDRGRVVDEYVSVPEFHGPLPPGDVVGLAANPTAVARLTGADPAHVRAVARTAQSAGELPPAPELIAELGGALRLAGADHGHEQALRLPDALVISR
jgi:ribosomal protein S18 acetylase RimI-like enzyme